MILDRFTILVNCLESQRELCIIKPLRKIISDLNFATLVIQTPGELVLHLAQPVLPILLGWKITAYALAILGIFEPASDHFYVLKGSLRFSHGFYLPFLLLHKN